MDQSTRQLIAYSILAAVILGPVIWGLLVMRRRQQEEVRRYSARRRKER